MDRLRRRCDPPVDQIEMMGRLVDEQTAGLVLVAVPAAEIVGAVDAVEIPAEIDGGDLADDAGHQQVLHLGAMRRVAVVEGNRHRLAGLLLGVEDGAEARHVDGHRLFGDDVGAEFERPHDVFVVQVVGHGDDDRIRLLFADHAVECLRRVGGDRLAGDLPGLAGGQLQPVRVRVAQADELIGVGVSGDQGVAKHQMARASSDDGVFHRGQFLSGAGGRDPEGGRPVALEDSARPPTLGRPMPVRWDGRRPC